MKKIIDLVDGAKIFSGSEVHAQEMIEIFISIFPETREELHNAYCAYESNPAAFRFVVDKFYDGLLYVGAPALRQVTHDLLTALKHKEEDAIDNLYQQVLKEVVALEKKMAKMKMADKSK